MSKYLEDGQHVFEKNRHMCTGFDPRKIYLLGEKYSGLKSRGAIQKFEDIRSYYLRKAALFEDPQFIPGKVELGEQWDNTRANIKWLRPQEIVQTPIFLEAGEDRFDVNQGTLGDCWFLAALANVTQNTKLLELIIPENQSYSQDYAGVFHFRFWQYGRWIDVVIDDRLPTIDGKLIFTKSKYENVFWTPLLEKAYAKLYGSYKNIEGGFISDALEDLTGGLNEVYLDLVKVNKDLDLFNMMLVSFNRKSYMGCGITSSGGVEEERGDGLYSRHAYSITNVTEVSATNGEVYKLLRIRNPWGTGEWNGDWSDNSKAWDLLPQETRNKLLVKKENGEFWMQFEQFIEAFNLLEFCHPNPDSLAYTEGEIHQWKSFVIDGAWVSKVSNGGVPSSRNFWLNSQYILDIKEKGNAHRVLIAIMQKNRRIYNLPELKIGFAVYTLKATTNGPLSQNFFASIKPTYIQPMEQSRQVTGHLDLTNGSYCIIPFTESPQTSCEYLVRVYSTVNFDVGPNDVEVTVTNPSGILGRTSSSSDVVDGNTADNAIQDVYKSIAGDDQEVGWRELKSILDLLLKAEGHEFSKELCRSMVAMADMDASGKLNFHEFYQLWEEIGNLRGIFRQYDSDNSKGMSTRELRQALKAASLQVSNKILAMIILRYGNQNTELETEDFLHCCIKLKTMIGTYNSKKNREENLEQWLLETMYT